MSIMNALSQDNYTALDTSFPIWDQIFTVSPLVVIGTKEGDEYDLAPKHLVTPVSFGNYFGFVCTPRHSTYHNVKKTGFFTVSYPIPDQVILTSLSAASRKENKNKFEEVLKALPTLKAKTMDALMIANSYLFLECRLFKIIDGFEENSFITGKIERAVAKTNYMRISEQDEQEQILKNPLLAYIAYGRFAKIDQTFNFPFPKDFNR